MPPSSRLARSLVPVDKLPAPLARRARSLLMRRVVPFLGTAKVDVVELTTERCVATVKNGRAVQNHIGTVHAGAMVLVAETATGMVVGMSVADERIPVVKSIKVEFKKRAKGAIRAEASLTAAQIEQIRTTEKGEVVVAVKVTDETGIEPIQCEMIWAWTPKRRDPKPA
jgi:acyl-coenzyme A thioesterase PaaI-like protein